MLTQSSQQIQAFDETQSAEQQPNEPANASDSSLARLVFLATQIKRATRNPEILELCEGVLKLPMSTHKPVDIPAKPVDKCGHAKPSRAAYWRAWKRRARANRKAVHAFIAVCSSDTDTKD